MGDLEPISAAEGLEEPEPAFKPAPTAAEGLEPEGEPEAVPAREPEREPEERLELGPERRKPAARRKTPRAPAGRASRLMLPAMIGAALLTLILTTIFTSLKEIDYSDFLFFLVIFTLAAHFSLDIKGGGKINIGLAPLFAALVATSTAVKLKPSATAAGLHVFPAVAVIWMFLFGTIVAVITMMIGEIEREDITSLLMDFAGVGLTVLVFQSLLRLLPKTPELHGNYWPALLVSLAVAAAVYFLVQIAKETYAVSREGHLSATAYFKSTSRRFVMPFLAIGFVGALMGLVFIGIGMWSVLFALPLLLVIRYAYNRVAATDQYLLETIRTLAVVPEETGILPQGHAERVADISVAVARELGLAPEDVKQVQYAAYLHDIGAITKRAEAALEGQQQLTEAEGVISGGVDIVGKVDYLEVASEILRGREGLRDRVEDAGKRRAVSLGAGILWAVDDFEALVEGGEGREPISDTEAITEMNLERGVKYDSKVLRAIARVVPGLERERSSGAEGGTESSPLWGEQEG